ncbi:MAG: T9SS type A sorting domain-containing protein [Bacteroidetes bacterium]|nr:T9SS type A sorting domain-containing protein [Bacteroidota bacterium]
MKKLLLSIAALALFAQGFAQAKRNCGSHEHHLQMLQNDPAYVIAHEQIEKQTRDFEANPQKKTRAVKTIPVVFHVVYNTAAQNVSDAQVQSQLAVLNADFRKLNADWTNTPAVFQGLVADCEIQFCLAQQDPNGNATTGINRVSTAVTSFSTNNAVKYSAQGGANIWDRNKYLNIWVCNLSGGVLGYAQFPGGAAATDGVVITYTGFGTMGTAQAPFNKGRTATHEVGHWLNLYHIWGDDGTSCNGSDLVGDTPNQADENYGCPAFPAVSCANGPNGDMFMNYMDYTDDACMYMFSAGQKTRMDALFIAGGARVSLLTSPGCTPPVVGACGVPSGLNATAITGTTATLNWTAVPNAVSYNVQYRLLNAANWTTTTSASNSKALTGLTAGSTYQYQIQTVCNLASSAYSSIATFNTTAVGGGCTNNYESNNTRQTATLIATNTNILSMIGSTTDKDWYRITTTNAAPKLKVTLSTLPFDYDVRLYNANGTQIGISQLGGVSTETIKYNSSAVGATYYIQVYGYNGAFSLSNCYTLNASTSNVNWRLDGSENDELTNKTELNIFPNPAKDKIAVQFYAEANKNVMINVYNSIGQRIVSENNNTVEGENQFSFDLQNLSNGIYIMEMIHDDERKVQKFTIQK